MKPYFIFAGFFFFLFSPSVVVQGSAQVPINNGPELISGVGADANFSQTMNQQVGSMRFVGKVIGSGSKLPWDPIPVVVVCNGKTRLNVLADKKGEFDIEPTPRESEAVESKRDPEHMDPSQLVGCKVSAVLEGFKSTVLTIPNSSIMDDSDIGSIILRPDERATGSSMSGTTLSAPPDALKEFEAARADKFNRNLGGARRHLQKAVGIDPQFAEAWYQLGKVEEADKPQEALNAYQKSVAADKEYTPPYERIAALAAMAGKWQDVADAANHALQLNPKGTPQIWYFRALGNYNAGDTELAETAALTSLSLDPSHRSAPKTEQLLAVILARRGKYDAALQHLRSCLAYTAPGPEAELVKQQVAQLEKVVPSSAR